MEEFCDFLKEIDFFGKLPEFYINGKPKQASILGRILTIIFIIIYLIIFIYKLYRISQRLDVTFYDSYSNINEEPSVRITHENFSIFLAMFNDLGIPYIDETIYYPVAFFFDGKYNEIEIVRCDMDKVGSRYKNFFSDENISNYYCIKDVDYIFKQYMNSIVIEAFPCKNTTENNNHCKSKEEINEFLNFKHILLYFEDILLTPTNYENPIKEKINFLDTFVFVNFGQYLYTEMQLIRIETSNNIIGFDFLTNPTVNEFIKFDNVEIVPQPGYNLDDESNDYPICDFEFQLNDRILLEKRQYVQLIDVLGDVGGFMEFLNSFFGLICSLFGDILYGKIIVNNLFSFDIKKKLILIKKGNNCNYKYNNNKINEEKNINDKITSSYVIKKDNINNTAMNGTINLDFDKKSENYIIKKKRIFNRLRKNKKIETEDINSAKNSLKDNNKNKSESLLNINKKSQNKIINENVNNFWKIDQIKLKDLLIPKCHCFVGKRNNINKILMNEAMNIISEKLDILNIFRNMCSLENLDNNYKYDLGAFQMSEECSNYLLGIYK